MVGFVVLTQAYSLIYQNAEETDKGEISFLFHIDVQLLIVTTVHTRTWTQLESSVRLKGFLNSLCDKLRIRDRRESEP